jgi:hypothetical protein
MAFHCGEEIKYPNDRLLDIGILAKWEISDESINSISDLTVKCFRFLDFVPDEDNRDYKGIFIYSEGDKQIAEGVFTVDSSLETVVFQRDDEKDLIYKCKFDDHIDYVIFTFSEDGSEFVQRWFNIY